MNSPDASSTKLARTLPGAGRKTGSTSPVDVTSAQAISRTANGKTASTTRRGQPEPLDVIGPATRRRFHGERTGARVRTRARRPGSMRRCGPSRGALEAEPDDLVVYTRKIPLHFLLQRLVEGIGAHSEAGSAVKHGVGRIVFDVRPLPHFFPELVGARACFPPDEFVLVLEVQHRVVCAGGIVDAILEIRGGRQKEDLQAFLRADLLQLIDDPRSEEHTSELQSPLNLV